MRNLKRFIAMSMAMAMCLALCGGYVPLMVATGCVLLAAGCVNSNMARAGPTKDNRLAKRRVYQLDVERVRSYESQSGMRVANRRNATTMWTKMAGCCRGQPGKRKGSAHSWARDQNARNARAGMIALSSVIRGGRRADVRWTAGAVAA